MAFPKGLLWESKPLKGLCYNLNLESEVTEKASSPQKGKRIQMAFALSPMSRSQGCLRESDGKPVLKQKLLAPQGTCPAFLQVPTTLYLALSGHMVFLGLSSHLPFEITDHPVIPGSSGAQPSAWPRRSTLYESVELDQKGPLKLTADKAREARHEL